MRGPVTASASVVLVTALLGACARSRLPPPPREPPARVLAVGLDQISLRASAYVELHASLAAAARSASLPPAGLDSAVAVYRRALADDDADELLGRTTRALARCIDDRCADEALVSTPFSGAFARSLAPFVERSWSERARTVRRAVEIARAALTDESDALAHRLEDDLAIVRPHPAAPVDIVSEAPPPGRDAILPVVLGARSACFAKASAPGRVQDARIVDCVLVEALRAQRRESAIGVAITRELGDGEGARAWDALVSHAVAAVVTAWEPKHLSPTRRSALAVEPRVLEWLAERWRGRASGETPPAAFATSYAEAWRSLARSTGPEAREK